MILNAIKKPNKKQPMAMLLSAILLSILSLIVSTQSIFANGDIKQLNHCLKDNPLNFDPAQITTMPHALLLAQMFDSLVYIDKDGMVVKPELAESWSISKDGLVYTLHLRKGVQFHSNQYFTPTRDLQAEDVIYTIKRQMDESYKYFRKGNFMWVDVYDLHKKLVSYKALDNYTVEFRIKNKDAAFLEVFGMYVFWIHSAEYEQKMLDEGKEAVISDNPIGTGAYQFVDFKPDSFVHLKKFDKHWDAKHTGNIDRISFNIEKDENVRVAKLETGECDLLVEPGFKALEHLRTVKNVSFEKDPSLAMGWFNLNTKSNGLDDVNARRAVMYALEYNRYIKEGLHNNVERSASILPKGTLGYPEYAKPIETNLDKARQFLAKSKTPNGFETSILVDSTLGEDYRTVAMMIQSSLAKINITAKIVMLDHGPYTKELYSDSPNWGIAQRVWHADIPDPFDFYDPFLLCANVGSLSTTRFCDSKVDEKLRNAVSELDVKKRAKIYNEIHDVVVDQVPYIPFAMPKDFNAYRSDKLSSVYIPYPIDIPRFKYFSMK